jgi:hypothetical protein
MGVPTKFEFRRLWLSWCVYFSLIVHHLQDIRGVKISGGWKDEGEKFIFIKFQSYKVTYPPIFKSSDASGVFIFT